MIINGKKRTYQFVDISTAQGLKKAEQLKKRGWKVECVGFNSIEFSKQNVKKPKE